MSSNPLHTSLDGKLTLCNPCFMLDGPTVSTSFWTSRLDSHLQLSLGSLPSLPDLPSLPTVRSRPGYPAESRILTSLCVSWLDPHWNLELQVSSDLTWWPTMLCDTCVLIPSVICVGDK